MSEKEEIVGAFIVIILFLIFVGITLLFVPKMTFDLPNESHNEDIHYIREIKTEETSCSLLADACLVKDWDPICLIKDCIFY